MRLDQALVDQGLIETRSKAKEAILKPIVTVNNVIISKPSHQVKSDDALALLQPIDRYVSRGGLKLEKAMTLFDLDFHDKLVVDIGASTGGFTDCALQHGAKQVIAIDVGTGQLAPSLKNNPLVVNLENTHFNDIKILPETIDFFVMDVSFISILKLLPNLLPHMNEANTLVALFKPQFEAGREAVNKQGIVKKRSDHVRAITAFIASARQIGIYLHHMVPSPIKGKSGNIEYLMLLNTIEKPCTIHIQALVDGAFSERDD